jgi:hypothetical protein
MHFPEVGLRLNILTCRSIFPLQLPSLGLVQVTDFYSLTQPQLVVQPGCLLRPSGSLQGKPAPSLQPTRRTWWCSLCNMDTMRHMPVLQPSGMLEQVPASSSGTAVEALPSTSLRCASWHAGSAPDGGKALQGFSCHRHKSYQTCTVCKRLFEQLLP